jgi:hypothetical protein
MRRFHSFLTLLAVLAVVPGCRTTRPFDRSTEPGGTPLSATTSGGLVLTGQALSADPGLSVLDVIRRAMPQFSVTGYTDNHCPMVELRGKDSVAGNSDPDVYVDGTRTIDTCPLVTLQASMVGRLEIFPSGVTSRAGYPSRGHGVIMIFLQRADSSGGR